VDSDTVYSVTISTELDGKTITQISQQTEKGQSCSSNKDGSSSPPPTKDSKPGGDSKKDGKPKKK
jgi:hypothetical protein